MPRPNISWDVSPLYTVNRKPLVFFFGRMVVTMEKSSGKPAANEICYQWNIVMTNLHTEPNQNDKLLFCCINIQTQKQKGFYSFSTRHRVVVAKTCHPAPWTPVKHFYSTHVQQSFSRFVRAKRLTQTPQYSQEHLLAKTLLDHA